MPKRVFFHFLQNYLPGKPISVQAAMDLISGMFFVPGDQNPLSILLHFAFTAVFIPNRQDIHLHIFFAVFFLLLLLVSLFLLGLLLLLYSIVIEARSVPLHTNSPQPLIPFLYSKPRPHLWECWLRNNQPLITWSQLRSYLRVFLRVWGKYIFGSQHNPFR